MKTIDPSFAEPIDSDRSPALSSSALGILVFIVTELMFFAALISAYLIIKAGPEAWPPAGQPRLPIEASAVNSLILFASGYILFRGYRSFVKEGNSEGTVKLVRFCLLLGVVFVAVQGFEWVRLVGFGLTMTSSQYGAFFYLIVGTHGIHAIGALIGIWRLYVKLRAGILRQSSFQGVLFFWYFVVGIWPILYVLVYLS
ncbi:MAG: heme-copper oxidase subunit III [Opitutaceae bacterium]|nr:heme-copper oxidase subunit III [Opitutaceae bacterium]